MSVRTISLFTGCGGMDFGAHAAGAEIMFANDIDRDACDTFAKYFPSVQISRADITDVRMFPRAELLIGGYPCQSFSMGGNRDPHSDSRTELYKHFARCLAVTQPEFFIAENVSGLQKLRSGVFLQEQLRAFDCAGENGYRTTFQAIDAKDYGIPQTRKRLFIVGVRKDMDKVFQFPQRTHGHKSKKEPWLQPYASHGEVIKDLPLWPTGEFYERPHDPEGHWSWYYMSRNRKQPWSRPSFTIVANWRHITLHPASPVMKLTWSDLANGWKQRWDFSNEYEHVKENRNRPTLEVARRLSWRECARIQTFPDGFEPVGDVESKFQQIGNAVPPKLAEILVRHLISGKGLVSLRSDQPEPTQVSLAL